MMALKIRWLVWVGILLCGATASHGQWESLTEWSEDGVELSIADQIGDWGITISLVCIDGYSHIELAVPDTESPNEEQTILYFTVDGNPYYKITGFFERAADDLMVFYGINFRDEPAAMTEVLIDEMTQGRFVSLLLPNQDDGQLVSAEEWSLVGAGSAIADMRKNCRSSRGSLGSAASSDV